MNPFAQPYRDSNLEFWEIHDLLTGSYAVAGRINMWSFCRFETWRYRIHSAARNEQPHFLDNLARLWRDETGLLVAVALSEGGREDIHVIVRPGYKALESIVYDWVDSDWAPGRPQVETFVDSLDEDRKRLLTERGYCCQGEGGYLRTYDLSRVRLDYQLEPGFTVQDVLVDRNVGQRATAIGTAFDPDFELSEAHLIRWDDTRAGPGYRPWLELSVVGPDGRHAAGCLGWVDLANRVGEIEPVGTHPDFRRRGFASAVILECFNRLQAIGISHVFISSGAEPNPSNRLYESLGPAEKFIEEYWTRSN